MSIPQPIYVSGPMTYYPDYNTQAFADACAKLRGLGHVVHSPHEVQLSDAKSMSADDRWQAFMRADIALLLLCKTVVVLPGWECSRGALLEVEIAQGLKMAVLPIAQVAP